MSGILGYVGEHQAVPKILEGLRFLDYRGYDSTGVATLHNNEILLRKIVGTAPQLKINLAIHPIEGTIGLGHTRWATHGAPTIRNAHPLIMGNSCIVHNGIVENYKDLEEQLREEGYSLHTETDSEIIVCLFDKIHRKEKSILKSLLQVLKLIKGTYAFLIMTRDNPDKIIAAVNGNPLLIGLGENEFFVASDVTAFINDTPNTISLEDGDIAIISRLGVRLYDAEGKRKEVVIKKVKFTQTDVERGGYRHFMLKEIFEQPRVIAETINGRLEDSDILIKDELGLTEDEIKNIKRIIIVACGTSWHSALVGEFFKHKFSN